MYLFIVERRKGKKKEWRESLMCETNVDRFPLTRTPAADQEQHGAVP